MSAAAPRRAPWALAILVSAFLVSGAWAQEPGPAPVEAPPAAPPAPEVYPDAPGVVQGHVMSEDGEALSYTNVLAYVHRGPGSEAEFFGGTLAITGGRYVFRLPPGRYDLLFAYIGREKSWFHDLVIEPGSTIDRDVVLKVEPIYMDRTIDISSRRLTTSENAALQRQRQAAAVSDAITSEQIKRTSDSDAAAAIERVTGVSVVGGKYVFVRGLGDRYSSTLLNGAALGSPEPNKRTVPLDIFPTGVFDNIVVQKTFTPDMNGEFGGGVININTADYIDETRISHSFSTGFSSAGVSRSFLDYAGGSQDWLGHDDGTRAIPDEVVRAAAEAPINRNNYSAAERVDLRRDFRNVWTPRPREIDPNWSYTGTLATGTRFLGADWGVLGSLSHKIDHNTLATDELVLEQSDEIRRDIDRRESRSETLSGATTALSMRAPGGNQVKVNLLYTRSSEDRARIETGPDTDWGVAQRTTYQLAFTERTLKSVVAGGTHASVLGTKLEWKLAYSQALRNEPDRREVNYEAQNEGDDPRLSRRPQYPFTRLYGESQEDARSAQVDWTLPVVQGRAFALDLKTGLQGWERERATLYRRFGYVCSNILICSRALLLGDLGALDPESIIVDPEVEDQWGVEETTGPDDSYTGRHGVTAHYAMADLKLLENLRMVGGVRWERSDQRVNTAAKKGADVVPVVIERRGDDPLPALNLTWSPTQRMNLRASYSKTLNRPELREYVPLKVYNFDVGYLETGDSNLVQAEIESYDLRWEFYPAPRQYLALSWFYKDLTRPIERFVSPDVANYQLKPINGTTGLLRGWEVEVRSSLQGLWDLVHLRAPEAALSEPPLGDRLSVVFNYSRIHSQADTPVSVGSEFTRTRPLTGQAEYSLNTGLFYQGARWQASLLYKDFGSRLFSLGLGDVLPDIYEQPPAELDLSLGWRLGGGIQMKGALTNILDREIEFTQGDTVVRRYRVGRKISLGLSWAL